MATETTEKMKSHSEAGEKKMRKPRQPKPYKVEYDSVRLVVDNPNVKNVRKALASLGADSERTISSVTLNHGGALEIEVF